MEDFLSKERARAQSFASRIADPRQIALERAIDQSADFVSADWQLEAVGCHSFNARWEVRAKSPAAKRLIAAEAMGFISWKACPAEYQTAAIALRLYVPSLPWVGEALLCLKYGLRKADRKTIEAVLGRHVRLKHPHEGAAFAVLGVY